ncbi:MAG: 3-phosphoglycerate dehydrogenase, partial [Bilifractor sp.]|nr:3-phosphoglycerate dehydrogenase [Bilifractor sp.]
MYQYNCLNNISKVGLQRFSDQYRETDRFEDADAVLVRSAKMHDMEFGGKL